MPTPDSYADAMFPSAYDAITLSTKVNISTFIGLQWGGWALTLPFFASRIYVRIKTFRRLFWDDFLVLLACLMLLANAIIWQHIKTRLYLLVDVQGHRQAIPSRFIPMMNELFRGQLAAIFLFPLSLWCVKLSFLVFFRRLGRNVQRQKIVWWSVLAIVVVSFFAFLGSEDWMCQVPRFEVIAVNCVTPSARAFQRATFRARCAIDVISDAMIILVPMNILRKVQISLRQKLALAGIFSLTTLIMIIAIIRVTAAFPYSKQIDLPWLWTWSSIEVSVAIIVACLGSFRALFTQQNHSQRISEVKTTSGRTSSHGNWTKSPSALRFISTTSTIMNSVTTPFRHVNDDDSSGINLKPSSKEILVQREYIVSEDRPSEVV